ncbi:RNA polymerase sigma factor SigJ [Sphaerisporangium sp. TRM90804]|uniref:RNA polymerase sigma factor SigJ n=1 Tax=Sphaerisporangium sp. TRM90804 TaxID=3031113 RepID=UPI0024489370|nr:RNA polymerase sigma factor SigJ [Sphaerisporangium sp. TRM90804]MDH2426114.1 RNA polymerase sigma factor SigJ [Sphaerisporangium sp. TRM90804]
MTTRLEEFTAARPRLLGLAYRLLGEASEAEDVLQDAYLRWERSVEVAVPEAWLTKVVTNLCLNRLTSARARRESYVGEWLPEPVVTGGGALGPLETAEQRDSLSFGVLVLLERLTPPERAAFVLREAFGHSHREIAEILEIGEARARQLYRRAREHVDEPRRRFTATPQRAREIVERFVAAAGDGDLAGLERLLAEDVVSWADGGGKAAAARNPVTGRVKVARLFVGLARHPRAAGARFAVAWVNEQPAVLAWDGPALSAVIVPEFDGDRVVALRTVTNPDKLAYAAAHLS